MSSPKAPKRQKHHSCWALSQVAAGISTSLHS